MPVPQQPGTATTVVSTGTDESARFGIEGQSVRCARGVVKPTTGDDLVNVLDLIRRADYAGVRCRARSRAP